MTLANRITIFRFGLILVYFVLLHLALDHDRASLLLDISLILLVIAAFLDVLDGVVARRRGETSEFGRVVDPLVDKILICGSFIFFVGLDALDGIAEPWVATVFLIREFGVQAVRVDLEAQGIPFGASMWGKWKTLAQTLAAGGCLLYASHAQDVPWSQAFRVLILALVGLAVVSTVASGILYAVGAVRALRRREG